MICECRWAWLAGFVEGEGSFQIVRQYPKGYFPKYDAQLVATSCDRVLLERCKAIAGGCIYGPIGAGNERYRPSYRWCLRGTALAPALDALMPYLLIKRRQAVILRTLRAETKVGAKTGEYGRKAMEASERERRAKMKLAVNALNLRGTVRASAEQLAALAEIEGESDGDAQGTTAVA